MPLKIVGKCYKCGADIYFNDEQTKGFCQQCGTEFTLESKKEAPTEGKNNEKRSIKSFSDIAKGTFDDISKTTKNYFEDATEKLKEETKKSFEQAFTVQETAQKNKMPLIAALGGLGIIAFIGIISAALLAGTKNDSVNKYLTDNNLVATKEEENSDMFTKKGQRNGFDGTGKRTRRVGLYTFTIPDYVDTDEEIEENFYRSYIREGDGFAFIMARSRVDEEDPVSYEAAIDEEEHKGYLDAIKNGGELKNVEFTLDEFRDYGDTRGSYIEYTCNSPADNTLFKQYNYSFPSEDNNSWVYITITESENCQYDYRDDFIKILSTLQKSEYGVTSTAPGIYIGTDGSVMMLFYDGRAGYYYKGYNNIDFTDSWTIEDGVITIKLDSMFAKVVADISSGDMNGIMFNSGSIFWNNEQYYKLTDHVSELSVKDCEKLIKAKSAEESLFVLSELKSKEGESETEESAEEKTAPEDSAQETEDKKEETEEVKTEEANEEPAEENTEPSEEEQAEAELKEADKAEEADLKTQLKNMDVSKAKNLLSEKGYTVSYEHAYTKMDFNGVIESYTDSELDAYGYIVTSVKSVSADKKTITLYIDTKGNIESRESKVNAKDSLQDRFNIIYAISAVEMYGKEVFPYGFALHQMTGALAEEPYDENTWFIKYECYYKDAFGNKIETECEAKVKGPESNPTVYDFYVYD